MEGRGQQLSSPLESGKWLKFSVAENGIYKIDYTLLKASGINPDQVDPRKIKLFGNGTGMLPQSNSAPRINSLQEIAIKVIGEEDGKFDNGDFVMFYGQGPDAISYDLQRNIIHYENNIYSEENYYFLTVGNDNGKRVVDKPSETGSFPIVNTFDDFVFHEIDKFNALNSGREWFGEQFDISTSMSLKFNVPGIVENSEIKIVSGVMAQSFNPASFRLSLNDFQVTEQFIPTITNSQYGEKGKIVIDTITVNSNSANAPSNSTQTFKYDYVKGSSGKSIGYLDFLLANFKRTLTLSGNRLLFRSSESLVNSISTFQLDAAPSNITIWDVSDPFNSQNQVYSWSNNVASFSATTNELKTYFASTADGIMVPIFIKEVANQNLLTNSEVNMLIVTHPDFAGEAQRLANHRQSFNGINSLVVTTEEVYNDFSGGKQDPTAIRDYAKTLLDNGLKNLLLVGRCSYDFKDRLNKNTNFVPTYESRNSLSPLETYSSDDYFAFLEPDEGEWEESPAVNHTLDIGVGRLSLKTKEEAVAVVDKLISYDTNPKALGTWRKEIAFVADDGDFNLHQSDANKLADDIEANDPGFNTQKIFLDAFKQISKPSGQVSPDARKALSKALNKGVVIVNFTGHGSEQIWLQEQILDETFIEKEWKNDKLFPLMVTATCEFGRHDDPAQISSSELALVKKEGGAIGLVTAARPVNASTNATLNKAFYQSLFAKENGKYKDLGHVFMETKNNSVNGVSNRNFSLLGDPSMHLAISDSEIITTEIKTITGSDTLKALSKVVVKGEIQSGSTKDTGFNGTLTATVKDKAFEFQTLGDENPIFNYSERSNTLFRGEASVVDGSFQFEFILPKNIAYQVGYGKLSLYAKTDTNLRDAIGGEINFKIGESEIDDGGDKTPPVIQLYMGDTTFINGGITSSNTQLVARLSDQSGINIANYGIGNSLTAILDGDQSFEVGEYYLAAKDDFTRGSIIFPIEELEPGKHSIELKAWDTYNNPASAIVDFVVTKDNGIQIEKLVNYPNPFTAFTTFQFAHNRAGEDLEVTASIVDMHGQLVERFWYEITESPYLVTLPQWDGTNTLGTKMGNGIYLLRLTVRSLLDGSKNEQISKLIILN